MVRKSKTPLHTLAQQADIAFCDCDAITPFTQQHPCLLSCQRVHLSGSLHTPLAQSCHPLMTFGDHLYSLAHYQRMLFVTRDTDPHFKTLFPQLSNPFHILTPQQASVYHAFCVLSNNFSTLLWQTFFKTFHEQFNIPLAPLHAYLQQSCHNLQQDYDRALTGPLIRQDFATIERNLQSLHRYPAEQTLYQSFVDYFLKQ